jgi:putative sugar O-methyltransferase
MNRLTTWLNAIFLGLLSTTFAYDGPSKEEFAKWWEDYQKNHDIPKDLKQMENYFIQSDLITKSSSLWNYIGKANIEMLVSLGFENFKQTVSSNYFTWIVDLDTYAANLLANQKEYMIKLPKEELDRTQYFLPVQQFFDLEKNKPDLSKKKGDKIASSPKELNEKHPLFFSERSSKFNLVTALMIGYVTKIGGKNLLLQLEEPLIGSPPYIKWEGKRISQDILNSVIEYLTVSKHTDINQIARVVEVGAGSGRTAFCFMKLKPNIKYVICDIPPTLYVSQTYLTQVFPDKKIFSFRPFKSFQEIKDEYLAADLVFITPDQLAVLPSKSVDLFIAIGCLQEMRKEMIDYYFAQANRTATRFYFKSTEQTVGPIDGSYNSPTSYPVPSHWKTAFRENCFVPADHFHALYLNKA